MNQFTNSQIVLRCRKAAVLLQRGNCQVSQVEAGTVENIAIVFAETLFESNDFTFICIIVETSAEFLATYDVSNRFSQPDFPSVRNLE
jgi:hypothetical protein